MKTIDISYAFSFFFLLSLSLSNKLSSSFFLFYVIVLTPLLGRGLEVETAQCLFVLSSYSIIYNSYSTKYFSAPSIIQFSAVSVGDGEIVEIVFVVMTDIYICIYAYNFFLYVGTYVLTCNVTGWNECVCVRE